MASFLYRLGCRAFQRAFFAGVHIMPWREPAILRGAGSLEKLPSRLQAEGIDNVLLVTDKFLAGTPHFARLQNLLNESGVRFSV